MIKIFKNTTEVQDFIYRSYMRAIKKIDTKLSDKETRKPQLTRELLSLMNNPDKNQKNILVTGSKGKGSVSRMIAKILEVHGYKVGLYTSPHLTKFNERIRINGKAISDEDFIKYANNIQESFNKIENNLPDNVYIGPVGLLSVIAMSYFKDNETDYNILECGKGARFDDISYLEGDISVINTVFMEHVPQLGTNLKEIAYNKSGIIKENQKVVFVGEQKEEVINVIEKEAKKLKVPVKKYGKDFEALNIGISNEGTIFGVKNKDKLYKDLVLSLLGIHQAKNAALAISISEFILKEFNIEKVKNCFRDLMWPGRIETVNKKPLTIVDGCINRESTKYIKDIINKLDFKELITIIGIPDDKDYIGVVESFKEISKKIILTKTKQEYLKFTNNQNESVEKNIGNKYLFKDTIKLSIDLAYDIIDKEGLVLILGTQSLVRETKEYFGQDTSDLL
jgi:dihydrofolate synthase/folylpolyglutamate synthase